MNERVQRSGGKRQRVFVLVVVMSFMYLSKANAVEPVVYEPAHCEGAYSAHLQGLDVDGAGNIFWSFTKTIVKTDCSGRVVRRVDAPSHQGDLVYHDGRVYVAVNLGLFNDPQKRADSWVYVYDADDLSLLSKYKVDDVVYGAGGIAQRDGRFLVVGGLPNDREVNHLYEYDADFHLLAHHELASGHTHLGIQTATYSDGFWWFGCYGSPPQLLKVDKDFHLVGRYSFDCALGVAPIGKERFFIGRGRCADGSCRGWTVVAKPDPAAGLVEVK